MGIDDIVGKHFTPKQVNRIIFLADKNDLSGHNFDLVLERSNNEKNRISPEQPEGTISYLSLVDLALDRKIDPRKVEYIVRNGSYLGFRERLAGRFSSITGGLTVNASSITAYVGNTASRIGKDPDHVIALAPISIALTAVIFFGVYSFYPQMFSPATKTYERVSQDPKNIPYRIENQAASSGSAVPERTPVPEAVLESQNVIYNRPATDIEGKPLQLTEYRTQAELIRASSYFYPVFPANVDETCLEKRIKDFNSSGRGADLLVLPRFRDGILDGFSVSAMRSGAGYSRIEDDLVRLADRCRLE